MHTLNNFVILCFFIFVLILSSRSDRNYDPTPTQSIGELTTVCALRALDASDGSVRNGKGRIQCLFEPMFLCTVRTHAQRIGIANARIRAWSAVEKRIGIHIPLYCVRRSLSAAFHFAGI